MNTTLTKKESELWHLASEHLNKIGGIAAIRRNPDPEVRLKGKTEGTYEWAIVQTAALGSNNFSDEECQKLIDIIKGGK